ncbi:MAG: hypothetical protein BGP04_02585 [Rhizobiales bacterium 62-17]|nr:hypothetical protein [Hyphomicrobiales bacterium]OJY04313.1 MAG: hypothetical protein BGP04_02585 [Rhizobiales bacterium 62-17]
MKHRVEKLACVAMALGLSACATVENLTPTASRSPASGSYETLPADRLIGKWGMASYREEKDRARTERIARQCRQPYVIAKGPTDGVMMHVADDSQQYELALKRARDGKTYLGFATPPGDPQDREIVSMTDKEMIMRFVDPDANTRYGTFIYVRC